MKEPLVSIVTPVYNGERYIRECIDSVLAQTYKNWDYTIVDNCSADETLAIAQRYAERDSRIRVISNENHVSVGENHNIAVRCNSPDSKYCKVLAGDDWIAPEFLASTVEIAEKHPSISIVGTYALDDRYLRYDGVPFPGEKISGVEVGRDNLLGGPYVFGVPSSLLYRSDITRVRDCFYNENNLHSDLEVCFEFLRESDFGFAHKILTYIRIQEGTTTSYAERNNTYLSGWLFVLTKYGKYYLSDIELDRKKRQQLNNYYQFLGRKLLRKQDKEFWKFHFEKLSYLGIKISKFRLVLEALMYVIKSVFCHPVRTIKKIFVRN